MLGQPGKGEIRLLCKEQFFLEFPNLLFGQHEDGRTFFDATNYLAKMPSPLRLQNFFNEYRFQIDALCGSYCIDKKQVALINEEGHYLIDGTFIFLFISFVEPDFLAYICDRMFEVFVNGFTVSDTYLMHAMRERLPKEVESSTDDGKQESK